MKKYCCKNMREQLDYKCNRHKTPFNCPDNLVFFQKNNEYSLIVHDGGSSVLKINYCPWCGAKLK